MEYISQKVAAYGQFVLVSRLLSGAEFSDRRTITPNA